MLLFLYFIFITLDKLRYPDKYFSYFAMQTHADGLLVCVEVFFVCVEVLQPSQPNGVMSNIT